MAVAVATASMAGSAGVCSIIPDYRAAVRAGAARGQFAQMRRLHFGAMKVTVIGTGYVGLVTGACLADLGNDVLCFDVDGGQDRDAGRWPGADPRARPGRSRAPQRRRRAPAFRHRCGRGRRPRQVQFIAVGTPQDEDGSADLQYVLAAAREIGRHMTAWCVVVDKSTVPVGTAMRVRNEIDAALRERGSELRCSVVSNPEFLKEGAAVEDFMRPDRIVVGSDDAEATAVMRQLYAPFERNRSKLMVMDVASAELTKYAANAMLATRISFMNEMALLAEALGADIDAVRRGIGSDKRIGSHFLYAGCGYGGSCFPKDVRALSRSGAEVGRATPLLDAVDAVNDRQKQVLLDKIGERFGIDLRGKVLRRLGAGVQAGHRRHARSAERGADPRPDGAGRQGARL